MRRARSLVPVPQGKVVKNRVHLGCSAGVLEDLEAEIERLLSLGATIAWEERLSGRSQPTERWLVRCDRQVARHAERVCEPTVVEIDMEACRHCPQVPG